ncbi:IPT/TIG domain-containing protein [Streptomyces decoyicus]|uniref:IPT/TIG domain-containing protein n=1 Tax=Streptomyces decoyicus TaxID=249567 RepID=UPI00386F69CB|nr:IPT/TIG domain-containing protein [Streptomyces decoyicus]
MDATCLRCVATGLVLTPAGPSVPLPVLHGGPAAAAAIAGGTASAVTLMLTPCRPRGLLVVTDRGGNCVAVIDPESPGQVRTLGAPVALTAQGPSDCLALCTSVDGARAAAAIAGRALSGTFGFLNPFSGVFPDQGSYSGGTAVTLIGRHFTDATAVHFGARPAPSFTVLDDETIVTVSPRAAEWSRSRSPPPADARTSATSTTFPGPACRASCPPRGRSAVAIPSSSAASI